MDLRDSPAGVVAAEAADRPRPVGLLRRYTGIYTALFRNSLTREVNFKANFLLWLFVELLWFALQLAFNNVLYLHTDAIGTWTKWEVVMLIGTSHFIQQMFQAFFLVNCSQLSNLVHAGTLDFFLMYPLNSRFLISFRQVDLGGFIGAASGLAVVIYAAAELGLEPSPWQIAAYALLCLLGISVHYSLMFVMASMSFWTVRAQGLVMSYYNLFSVSRIPDTVLLRGNKAVLAVALPMLVVSNVPVRVLADKLTSPSGMLLPCFLALGCFLLSQLVWSKALRAYKSASS